ncbi:sigma-70 family RNA polymerase sigma factor [Pseudomonas granadensis]|uniref:sigma-70 family RNA polymerase sigma factor n=1 Tax=Pseudomonas granadensis TaxID=1421430 RepID=UPI001EEFA5FC
MLSRNRHVAEDLVHATCVRALERAGHYVAGTRIERWLLGLLHSIWINEVRTRRVRQEPARNGAETDNAFATKPHVMAAQVIRRVDGLPETQRAAVYLAYVEGFSYSEVAEILQVPVATVMTRLATARLKLAEYPPLYTVATSTEADHS